MTARLAPLTTVIVFGLLAQSPPAAACSCGGTLTSSMAAQHADAVFLGSVVRIDRAAPISHSHRNADGSTTVTVESGSGIAGLVVFDITHAFKGSSSPQSGVVRGNTTCDLPFRVGETWLIFGQNGIGGVTTSFCSRSRLLSEATQDVMFLRGVEAGRPQGIVYGEVLRRRNGPNGVALSALFEPLTVTAVGETGRFNTTTDRWGPFELVLPPGYFEIWVQHGETKVSTTSAIRVEHGGDVKLQLIVEYPDTQR
jgi:hypothetical protein